MGAALPSDARISLGSVYAVQQDVLQYMFQKISTVIFDAGERLRATATDSDFLSSLRSELNQLLSSPLSVVAGDLIDVQGNKVDSLNILICEKNTADRSTNVHIDDLACVIEFSGNLTVEQMRIAYERIANVKRLAKTRVPRPGVPQTTVTLGVILARDAPHPIEELAEELDRLNKQHSDRLWVDMIAVLSKGTINYAVQFPGEHVSGDFLPPAKDAYCNAPWYVVILMKPGYAFNRMLSFLIAHFSFFSPGIKLPNTIDVLADVPQQAITLRGYQYNLSGQLVSVPRQHYNDRYIAPRPVLISDKKNRILSTLQFLPWQDGAVVRATGKLPLEGFLVFLGKEALKNAGIVRRPEAQISYVLPISEHDFGEMLARIQRQSNMLVRTDTTKFVVQKLEDEGSSSPFFARLFLGNLRLSDGIFRDAEARRAFEKKYELVLTSLINTRATAKDIGEVWAQHASKVSEGQIARLHGNAIRIDESIDKKLRKEVESFLNSAVRTLKYAVPDMLKVLGVEIGFLFQKQAPFERGVEKLRIIDLKLASYLFEVRKWSEPLVRSRNAVEHEGWTLSRVAYAERAGKIYAEQPRILEQPVSQFVAFITDRLCCFVEEVTVHLFQKRMPEGIDLTEVPPAQRDSDVPERFHRTLVNGGLPVWNLAYHGTVFEEN